MACSRLRNRWLQGGSGVSYEHARHQNLLFAGCRVIGPVPHPCSCWTPPLRLAPLTTPSASRAMSSALQSAPRCAKPRAPASVVPAAVVVVRADNFDAQSPDVLSFTMMAPLLFYLLCPSNAHLRDCCSQLCINFTAYLRDCGIGFHATLHTVRQYLLAAACPCGKPPGLACGPDSLCPLDSCADGQSCDGACQISRAHASVACLRAPLLSWCHF